jgi:hypothetical protein
MPSIDVRLIEKVKSLGEFRLSLAFRVTLSPALAPALLDERLRHSR